MTQIKTVIIIGAGFAGLRAASILLQKRGIRLLILEGRDRLGGRAHTSTAHSWKTPLDLGCAWIHGTTRNPLTPIAEAAQAQYYELESSALRDNENWLPDSKTRKIFDLVFSLGPQAVEYSKVHHDDIDPQRSFYSFCLETIERDETLDAEDKLRAKKLAHFYTNISAEEVTKQSLRNYLLEEELPGASPMVASTYGPILSRIADDARRARCIQMETKVHTIEGNPDGGLLIHARNRREGREEVHHADVVLVTVPLGVLRARTITFSPALPQRVLSAIDAMGMGSAEKLFIQFATPFWEKGDDALVGRDMYAFLPRSSDDPLIEFISLAKFPVNAQPVLLCFSAADVARSIAQKWKDGGREAVKEFVMPYVRSLPGYAQSRECEIVDLFSTDWTNDEFSFGSYSYAPVGSLDTAGDCNVIARGCPELDIFFAGEHAASAEADFEIGTAHGAYSSGKHAAKMILQHLSQ